MGGVNMATAAHTVFRGDVDDLPVQVNIVEKLSPENYNREVERIFRRSWLPVAHLAELPRTGSYAVVDVPTFRTSLLVMRGRDGVVRSFHNICRHRGNKLIRAGTGCRPTVTCGFHGWSFAPDGQLAGVPDQAQFRDFDKSTLNLIPVHTEVWEGLVFVNFDQEPRWTLAEWLGPLYDQFSGYWDDKEKLTSYQADFRCNWHLGVNSFTEGYHTLFLHKNTVPDYQGGRSNPLRHRPFMEMMQRHHRYSAPRNPDHKATPAEVFAFKYGRKLVPAYDGDSTRLPPGVNPARADNWAFDVIELFPNFVMLNSNNWHLGIWFWPVDAGRTVIRADRYLYKAKTAGERLGQAYSKVRAREVLREDLNTMEATQTALMSGVMQNIVLSQQELALQHHYKVTDDMLRDA
jgi:glycine betaine catabolism A